MNILNLFRRRRHTAPVARERLQILLSHERSAESQPDLLVLLHKEILATVMRQVPVESENVRVRVDRGAQVSTLAIDVEIPNLNNKLTPRPVPAAAQAGLLATP